jgi:hypothetical protein
MGEHYTKNTLECTAWCAKCQKNTQHRVDDGRRGPCIDPDHPYSADGLSDSQRRAKQKKEKEQQNPRLF